LIWGYVHREEGAPWYLNLAAAVLGIVVPLLFLVGLAGLAGVYAKCRTRVGWPSLIGFVVSFAGVGLFTIRGFPRAPVVFIQLDESLLQLSLLLNSPLSWLLGGLAIVGLSAVRKEALKGWGYLLVAMVLFGWVYQLTDDEIGIIDVRSVHVVFGMLFSLSWMLLGYALWSAKDKLIYTPKTGN